MLHNDPPLPSSPAGLTSQAAADALRASGPNELEQARPHALWHVMLEVLRDPMFLLLAACGGFYLLLGDLRDSLMLLGFVLLIVAITIHQRHKTERALAALKELASPQAVVIRDGERRRIPARELVPGDLAAIAEGDRVPADGLLESGTGILVDESLLTGESAPVPRAAEGGDARVFLGTLVLQGRALMRVTATGPRTALGGIGRALTTLEHPVTRLETETRRVVSLLAAAGVGVSGLMAAGYALSGAGWLQGALAGLTLAMSVIPEEFPVVLTVFLALGAWRLARHRVLTRRTNAIETLGATNVLCVDKTGTLTLNRMRLAALHDGHREIAPDAPEAAGILRHAALASALHPFDPMEQALRAAAAALPGPPGGETPLREYPLSHDLLAMTRLWSSDGTAVGGCKGAPETVLELCRLEPGSRQALERQAAGLAQRGWRVLGVAAVADAGRAELPASQRALSFHFLGFVAFEDPLRPGVPEAVRECREAGIRVLMVTGDHRLTASSIAAQAGLAQPESVLGGDDLEAMDDTALTRRLDDTGVYCRITPPQKLRLVRLLQAQGLVVAMTGDGVNDAPALKAADIGIAMGGRGTDVAREAADIVLADDDFPSIVRGVRMGRRIHGNLARAITYIIAVHVPIMGLAVLPLLAGWPLLLMPVHVMLVEMLIDPACSVVLEAEPEEPGVMRRPPRPLGERLFSAARVRWGLLQGLFGLLAVIGACSLGVLGGVGTDSLRSMAMVALMLVNLALINVNRTPLPRRAERANPTLWWVAGSASSALLIVVFTPGLNRLFHLALPGPLQFTAAAGAALAAGIMLALLRRRAQGI
jgi:Ca2+-transporting ATPase